MLTSWQLILYGTSRQPVHLREPPAPGSGDIDEDLDNVVDVGQGGDVDEEEEAGGSGIKVSGSVVLYHCI